MKTTPLLSLSLAAGLLACAQATASSTNGNVCDEGCLLIGDPDINHDGFVNSRDVVAFVKIRNRWWQGALPLEAVRDKLDLNFDDQIDDSDLAVVVSNFGAYNASLYPDTVCSYLNSNLDLFNTVLPTLYDNSYYDLYSVTIDDNTHSNWGCVWADDCVGRYNFSFDQIKGLHGIKITSVSQCHLVATSSTSYTFTATASVYGGPSDGTAGITAKGSASLDVRKCDCFDSIYCSGNVKAVARISGTADISGTVSIIDGQLCVEATNVTGVHLDCTTLDCREVTTTGLNCNHIPFPIPGSDFFCPYIDLCFPCSVINSLDSLIYDSIKDYVFVDQVCIGPA